MSNYGRGGQRGRKALETQAGGHNLNQGAHQQKAHDYPGDRAREVKRVAQAETLLDEHRRVLGVEVEQSQLPVLSGVRSPTGPGGG